jgi:hypothetical protein
LTILFYLKDVSSRPALPRMESEPILPIVKELEDSLRSDVSLDQANSDIQSKDTISSGKK